MAIRGRLAHCAKRLGLSQVGRRMVVETILSGVEAGVGPDSGFYGLSNPDVAGGPRPENKKPDLFRGV